VQVFQFTIYSKVAQDQGAQAAVSWLGEMPGLVYFAALTLKL